MGCFVLLLSYFCDSIDLSIQIKSIGGEFSLDDLLCSYVDGRNSTTCYDPIYDTCDGNSDLLLSIFVLH
jgi:hypothetical protein